MGLKDTAEFTYTYACMWDASYNIKVLQCSSILHFAKTTAYTQFIIVSNARSTYTDRPTDRVMLRRFWRVLYFRRFSKTCWVLLHYTCMTHKNCGEFCCLTWSTWSLFLSVLHGLQHCQSNTTITQFDKMQTQAFIPRFAFASLCE